MLIVALLVLVGQATVGLLPVMPDIRDWIVDVLAMAGEWIQVTAVYDMEAGSRSVYVNGVLDVQIADAGVCAPSTHNVYIGARVAAGNTPEGFFDGMIDDVRVFSRALSAGEALSLAGGAAPIDKPF